MGQSPNEFDSIVSIHIRVEEKRVQRQGIPYLVFHCLLFVDDDIAVVVCNRIVASYSLEATLGDCKRSAWVRRRALELMSGKSQNGLPLEGFDYESILG
jgi:hypothetical protein